MHTQLKLGNSVINDAQYQTLLERCRALPPAKKDYRVNDYLENLLLTVVDFQIQTPVVEKAMLHYHKHARAEVYNAPTLGTFLQKHPDTREGNETAARFLWGYRLWTRLALLRRLFAFFDARNVRDQEALHAWAQTADFETDFRGEIKGLGYAIFNWLVMRQGVETIKPDSWVHRFVADSLGAPTSNETAVAVLIRAARELQLPAYELDWRIWEAGRASVTGTTPAPAVLPQETLEPVENEEPEESDMNLSDINALIGTAASAVALVTGYITINAYVKQNAGTQPKPNPKLPPNPPAVTLPVKPPAKQSSVVASGDVTLIRNDDAAYLKWLQCHPAGFVVNTPKRDADQKKSFILHRATCGHILPRPDKLVENTFTGRDYIKFVADSKESLTEVAKQIGCPDGTFTGECGHCLKK